MLICTVDLTVSFYHVTYVFQSESTLYSSLNVQELLGWNRFHPKWNLNDFVKINARRNLTVISYFSYSGEPVTQRLVCISNVSYLQLTVNLQLKNEHICGFRLTRWSFGLFLFIYLFIYLFFRILSTCVWKISFSIKSKVVLSFSLKKAFGRLILNKKSWKWVFVKGNLYPNSLCFLLSFWLLFIENVKRIEKSPSFFFFFECLWNRNVSIFNLLTVPQNCLLTESY